MNASTTLPVQQTHSEPLAGNYFVAAYPPFSSWRESECHALEERLQTPAPDEPVGVYVHVPFCSKKCDYCYYLSLTGRTRSEVDKYLEHVAAELSIFTDSTYIKGRPLAFVYVGGGTPSLLATAQMRDFFQTMRQRIGNYHSPETTFECAPKTTTRPRLDALAHSGVNRISMGVQSFDDELLRKNGRVHLSRDVYRAFAIIQEFGFEWVNLDLMAGMLGETRQDWRRTVSEAIRLNPDSVTIYQTEIPRNTQLYRDLVDGNLPAEPVDWDTKRERVDYAFGELERAGYTIVSAYNASKRPERRFQYQEHLWRGGDMIGLGLSSFSYLGGVHYQNAARPEHYRDELDQGRLPVQRAIRLSDHDRLTREFILQLKWGEVAAEDFRTKFGVNIFEEFGGPLQELRETGHLKLTDESVQITRKGLLCVDRLLPAFYSKEYSESPYW
ncbi:MAG: coproporphyrinogen-III oxidase family protein [Planctomycetota bacterium]|nr:coproporphyrinogen-III oxidase family protein [Planctomycetota bacterium]